MHSIALLCVHCKYETYNVGFAAVVKKVKQDNVTKQESDYDYHFRISEISEVSQTQVNDLLINF